MFTDWASQVLGTHGGGALYPVPSIEWPLHDNDAFRALVRFERVLSIADVLSVLFPGGGCFPVPVQGPRQGIDTRGGGRTPVDIGSTFDALCLSLSLSSARERKRLLICRLAQQPINRIPRKQLLALAVIRLYSFCLLIRPIPFQSRNISLKSLSGESISRCSVCERRGDRLMSGRT